MHKRPTQLPPNAFTDIYKSTNKYKYKLFLQFLWVLYVILTAQWMFSWNEQANEKTGEVGFNCNQSVLW